MVRCILPLGRVQFLCDIAMLYQQLDRENRSTNQSVHVSCQEFARQNEAVNSRLVLLSKPASEGEQYAKSKVQHVCSSPNAAESIPNLANLMQKETIPSTTIMWTSKLGHKYPQEIIERNHEQTMRELREIRQKEANSRCADCGKPGSTIWSSVNLGVFLCLECGSRHRALGTHISKPKGCTGTYLWGPDEILQMKQIGNARAQEIYGGEAERPRMDAPEFVWMEYLKQKYVDKKFAPTASSQMSKHYESRDDHTEKPLIDLLDFHSSFSTSDHHLHDSQQQHKHQEHRNSLSSSGADPSNDVIVHVKKDGGGSTDFFAQFGV